jgi:hypothetical protein
MDIVWILIVVLFFAGLARVVDHDIERLKGSGE